MASCYIDSGVCEGAGYFDENCSECDIIVCHSCMETVSSCPNCGDTWGWG